MRRDRRVPDGQEFQRETVLSGKGFPGESAGLGSSFPARAGEPGQHQPDLPLAAYGAGLPDIQAGD